MNPEVFFLDTSIPIYAAGKPSSHKESCMKVLERVESGELKAAIDTEVVQEILYRFHRLGMQEEGVELCRHILRLGMKVLPVVRGDIDDALQLFDRYYPKGIPPRDALHTAVMLNNRITKIITLDKHFGDVIEEVKRIEPGNLLH